MLKNWNRKGCCFSSASLRTSQQVATFEQRRDSGRLNWCGGWCSPLPELRLEWFPGGEDLRTILPWDFPNPQACCFAARDPIKRNRSVKLPRITPWPRIDKVKKTRQLQRIFDSADPKSRLFPGARNETVTLQRCEHRPYVVT